MEEATKALLDRDLALAEQVISDDVETDDLRDRIEEQAYAALMSPSPEPADLRVVISAVHAASDLERMGDLALHVAESARRRHPGRTLPDQVRGQFEQMGQVAVALALQAGETISSADPGRVAQLELDDDVMDELHRSIFVVLGGGGWPHGVAAAVDVTLLSRFYERYADHAVAVARRTAFALTGRDAPRSQRLRLITPRRPVR